MDEPFLGFELLLFRRFQSQPALWYEWRDRLRKHADPIKLKDESIVSNHSNNKILQTPLNLSALIEEISNLGVKDIHEDLWYLSVMLHRRPKHLLELVKHEMEREQFKRFPKAGETLLVRYMKLHNFTVLVLDSMFKFGDDNRLPREIFRCPNVKYLSLKYNGLEQLPCDIGRMSHLEYLALTNNKLSVLSLPYSLTFLTRLQTLLLDNNLLDALPGFLTTLPSLKTVHRHGNHNYFKSTFMWYHTDVNLRVIAVPCEAQVYKKHECLQFWASKTIIGSKSNFFENPNITPVLKDYIADVYSLFNICHHCDSAKLASTSGYKVITFKNPYLGNTCVPFQHWACSLECARAVEIPARTEQILAARHLDQQYEDYIAECVTRFSACRSPRSFLAFGARDANLDMFAPVRAIDSSGFKHISQNFEDDDSDNTETRRRRRKRSKHSSPFDSSKTRCGCVVT